MNNGTPVASDANGRFSVSFPGAHEYRLTVSSPDYVFRVTCVSAGEMSRVISLIPASFNLIAFDVSLRSAGLSRWMSTPSLVVLTREVQYRKELNHDSDTALVLDRELSPDELASLISELRDGFLTLTDGRLGDFKSVTLESPAAGTSVLLNREGVICVARARDLGPLTNWGGATGVVVRDNVISSATILLDPWSDALTDNYPSHARKHEMGHAVGFDHVEYDSVMNVKDLKYGQPTAWDRDAARIAYQRPPGNRTPDADPPTVLLTLR